jgi:hypothetical protein
MPTRARRHPCQHAAQRCTAGPPYAVVALPSAALASTYHRREPEKTIFYGAVRDHLETMLAEARALSDSGAGLPFFVEREFRALTDPLIFSSRGARAARL